MEIIILLFLAIAILKIVVAVRNRKARALQTFLARSLKKPPPGSTVLITGGNRGIGLSSAKHFCRLGARVIIACRSQKNADEAVSLVKRSNPSALIESRPLDLASLQSVRDLVRDLGRCGEKISALVNNAGLMSPNVLTGDGFDSNFQVNYLGHFLLTRLLLREGLLAEEARVVNVTSAMHRLGTVDFNEIHLQRAGLSRVQVYSNTKLMNIMFSNELSRRLAESNSSVVSVSVHPGMVYTDMQNHFVPAIFLPAVRAFVKTFTQSPDEGSAPVLRAALDPDIAAGKFVYLHELRACRPHANADPREKGVLAQMRQLWALSSALAKIPEEL